MDIFGGAGEERGRLHLEVRFCDSRKASDGIIGKKHARVFSSLYLNQLKVSLSILGVGLSNLNILPKDSIDKLLFIAGGSADEYDRKNFIKEFWDVFNSTFRPPDSGGVVPVKLYVVEGDEIFSSVISFPAESKVGDLMTSYDLAGPPITQGVELRNDTPLLFLRNECHYADGFVHIVTFK